MHACVCMQGMKIVLTGCVRAAVVGDLRPILLVLLLIAVLVFMHRVEVNHLLGILIHIKDSYLSALEEFRTLM